MAGDVQRLGGEARGGLKAKTDGARWEGVNAGVTRGSVKALRAAHGGDPHNAGHAAYTSLDQDMLPRALKLAALGEDADEKQQKELRRLWQSLGPESRAQMWTGHKDDLIAAGLLTPQVKRVAADKGAGRYGAVSPGASDYGIYLQAKGMSTTGDFIGMTDAARHMDHYLRGSGRTLDLDVDRMLTDSANLRDKADELRADEQDEWRRQALEAFEKAGGKPVAIPVETGSDGYNHAQHSEGAERNWFLAVGSGMTNSTGVVTAVPGGPDGKPQVSIEYQVNVWDRYNWDARKFTDIGPTSVTDADMARLHTTGLAREFDMRGSSSVQRYDLGPSGPGPAPVDPGRDGTRGDLGWNGDAR